MVCGLDESGAYGGAVVVMGAVPTQSFGAGADVGWTEGGAEYGKVVANYDLRTRSGTCRTFNDAVAFRLR